MSHRIGGDPGVKKILVTAGVKSYLEKKLEEGSFFNRKDLKIVTVKTGMEVVNQVNEERPFMAILDAEMPGMAGHTVAGVIKKDRKLADTIVLLVSPASERRRLMALCQESKADAFDVLDAQSDALANRVGQFLNIAKRTAPRIEVDMHVDSPSFVSEATGRIKNISAKGLLIEVRNCNFERGYPLILNFKLEDKSVEVHGDIVRMFYSERAGLYDVGVEFRSVSEEIEKIIGDYVAAQEGGA